MQSRTPLFRLIARSLELARQSNAYGIPTSELLEQRDERLVMSRRRFVAGTAAATAAVALDGCIPPRMRGGAAADGREPVLIIGAGLAGLTAGYRLRQAGVTVRILEAQNRTGGRMYSLRDFFPDGQVCELGGELIDTGHSHIRRLASELSIELDDLSTDDPALASDVWYFGGQRRSEHEVIEAFRPIAAHIARDIAPFGDDAISYHTPLGAEPLDQISIAEWLDRAGASGWVRELLDVGYTTEFGLEIGDQSALNLLTMIDTTPEPFRIYGESDERFHVRGGNDRIPHALATRLEDAIETGMVLESLRQRADGAFVCSLHRGPSSVQVTASHVLIAIPFTTLRDVQLDVELPPAKRRAIAELGYGMNAKLMVGFSERIWRTAHRSNGSTLTNLPYQLTWETSRLQPGASGILTNFTGGRHGLELGEGSAAEQAARLTQQLEYIFPGAAAARRGMREVRFHWPSHPWTKGSYASYRTGQWTSIAGAEGEPVGRLYFAGEHCSRAAQGFMEGACETGERAAQEILAGLGARRESRRREPVRLLA